MGIIQVANSGLRVIRDQNKIKIDRVQSVILKHFCIFDRRISLGWVSALRIRDSSLFRKMEVLIDE